MTCQLYFQLRYVSRVLELIHEAKWLTRLGIQVPEAAAAIMAQESRFKNYKSHLELILNEYRQVGRELLMAGVEICVHYTGRERTVNGRCRNMYIIQEGRELLMAGVEICVYDTRRERTVVNWHRKRCRYETFPFFTYSTIHRQNRCTLLLRHKWSFSY